MQNLSPLAPQFSLEKKRRLNPHFVDDKSPYAVIRKIIFTQEIEQKNSIEKNLSPVFFFIKNNDLENLEKLITEYPELLNQKYQRALTPVFFAIEHNNLEAFRIIIKIDPKTLNQVDRDGLTPIFTTIVNNNLETLKIIIETYPEDLSQAYDHRLTPVFFAIENNNLEALRILIKTYPKIVEQKYEDDLTPIFFAIESNNLKALRILIEERPETLWQEYEENLTPIFFAINDPGLDDKYIEAIKTITDTYPQILEQEDVNKNTAIIKIVELYEDNPSKPNKNLLQKIFTQQFQKKLENEDIENLVKFVRNLYLLKLIYEDSGQIIRETMLKKILLSTLILDPNDEDDIFKQLILIYQKICQEKTGEITFFNQKGAQNSLHIFNSEISDHSSYFVFHVDEKNKLTAISYCDGNLICDERKIDSNYINGAITYDFKILIDFSEEMVKNFIDQNFREKDIDIIYDNFEGLSELFRDMINDFIAENFNERDANVLREKITESDFIKTTYSIPIQAQERENCTFKSINILARFLLEQQQQQTIFGFDFINSQPYGIGHEAYKNVKERMVENATQNLILSAEKLGKEFCDKVKFFENIKIFLEKSSKKKTPATRFSQSSVEKITEFLTSNEVDYVAISRKRNFSQLL
jgi:ankyrin repeat protein